MAFDRYMIQVGAAAHPKFEGMTVVERYGFFLGVLSIAAAANPRGELRIGGRQIGPRDVSNECGISYRSAARTLEKLRDLGAIVSSSNGFERVRDFDQWNTNPRSDATNAERQRRYRERRNTPAVTLRNGREVEVEVKRRTPPTPPSSRNGVTAAEESAALPWLTEAFPDIPTKLLLHSHRELRLRDGSVTVEAVRNYLIERNEPERLPKNPDGNVARICGRCRHLEGDHKPNKAPYPHPVTYGFCLIDGCPCQEYTP